MKIEILETLQIEKIKIYSSEKMIQNKVYQEKENFRLKLMITGKLCKAKNKTWMINKSTKKTIKMQNKIKMIKKPEIIIKKNLLIKTKKKKELKNKL